MAHFNLIVLGAGALGSAVAYHAARRGARVLLLEQYAIDHQRGSSHGASRIIRYAYDHPIYVALARLAFPEWRELEAQAAEQLMFPAGGLDFGPRGEPELERTISALTREGVPFELLSAAQANVRFPQFRFSDEIAVVYQADSAILAASRCVLAHVRLAVQAGAQLRENALATLTPLGDGVQVSFGAERHTADHAVVCAGAWANDLLAPLGAHLPLRPVLCQENYFEIAGLEDYSLGRFPVFIAHLLSDYGYPSEPYGLPSIAGSGLKLSLHGGPDFDPHREERVPLPSVHEVMRSFAARFLSQPLGALRSSRACLYTMTPDEHFVLGRLPGLPQILLGAACSGHAFKFSTVLGRLLTELALDGDSSFDLSFFSPTRFSGEA